MKNLRLKSARAAKDLSQQQLAELVKVSRQTISAIEKGDYNPTINLCIAICKALDKTLEMCIRDRCNRTDIIALINQFNNECEDLRKQIPMNIFSKIVYTDTKGKLRDLKNFL